MYRDHLTIPDRAFHQCAKGNQASGWKWGEGWSLNWYGDEDLTAKKEATKSNNDSGVWYIDITSWKCARTVFIHELWRIMKRTSEALRSFSHVCHKASVYVTPVSKLRLFAFLGRWTGKPLGSFEITLKVFRGFRDILPPDMNETSQHSVRNVWNPDLQNLRSKQLAMVPWKRWTGSELNGSGVAVTGH